KILDRQVQHIEEMVQKNPQNPDARLNAANFYLETGMLDQAIEQAQQALKIKDNYAGAYLVMGRAYAKKGDTENALKNYDRVLDLNKDNPMAGLDRNVEAVYYEVGQIYYGQGKYAEATDALQKALKIDGTDADALYSLGVVYQKQNDNANAVKQFEEALRFDPMFGSAYEGLAVSYSAIGNAPEAAYAAAMVLYSKGKYSEAASQLEGVVQKNPDLMRAYFGLGLAYDKVGKPEQAVEALKKYVQANPDDIAGNNALARVSKEIAK
ncbi:MAG TPA: tetratricopeptide repeat protein, partial [Chloroflexota bacterium]